MSFLSIIKKIFGDKSSRDLKAIRPILDKCHAEAERVKDMDADALRAEIDAARANIAASCAPMYAEIESLRGQIEELSWEKRQPLWDKIDELNKQGFEAIEKALNDELPRVFATLQATARLFANNDEITVTATDMDRNLAGEGRDFVRIEGDKAIWRNRWTAGGNELKWDMVHYDVQLIGGIVLFQGKIAEMATGEGKTLVATLPVFLRSLAKLGVHVVTVNDYLAKRDSEWMGPLYMFHGQSVDCIDKHEPNSLARRNAYNCDITYGTNNEFGFDYLRDNMAGSPGELVQRRYHYFAIVDEVDSVLIDDARTPLIISGPVSRGDDQLFDQFKSNVAKVVRAQQQLVNKLLADAKTKLASEDKEERKEGAIYLFRAFKGLPKNGALIRFLSQEGMKNLLLETEAYYLQDNQREMPKITDDLYFVIDEKNRSVELTDKGIDELTGHSEDPQFFVLPDIAAQLSEAETITDPQARQARKDELMADYAVKSERVHTVTQLLKAYALFERDVEYVIDDNKIKIVDEQTGRIMEGRRYSDGLHQAIEAKENVKVEAATQTFATITLQNYFRMYYKLAGMTGTAETEAGEFWEIYKLDVVTIPTNRPVLRNDMNDRVYRTKKAKYKAVIAEIVKLVGEGRSVLVGTTSVEISELLSRMLDIQKIPHQVLNAKLHQREAQIVALAGQPGTVTIATNMAGRGTDIKLSDEVRAAGGLAIIGTERHESRRVDRQLRGRAGRQGDPGSSVFFVSFEDQLMRLFATDGVVKMLDRLGLEEDEMIQSSMVDSAIEKAQKRVEENNFGIRKRLLEFDDVMNKQRNYIYDRRRHAVLGERLGADINNMIYETVENIVNTYSGASDYADLNNELFRVLAIENPIGEEEFMQLELPERVECLHAAAMEGLGRKSSRIREIANPVLTRMAAETDYDGLVIVPITDGKRVYNLRVDLRKSVATECRLVEEEWQKAVVLMCIDELWKEHLRELDQLKQSVQNAAYEQKDPLVIYKVESFHLFERMLNDLNVKAASILMRGQIHLPEPREGENTEVQQTREEQPRRNNYKETKQDIDAEREAQRRAASAPQSGVEKTMPVKSGPRIGRNDPCPCGSGKKFKNCHGKGM